MVYIIKYEEILGAVGKVIILNSKINLLIAGLAKKLGYMNIAKTKQFQEFKS